VKTRQDEAGAVTTFIYDYEETTRDLGNIIRIDIDRIPPNLISRKGDRITLGNQIVIATQIKHGCIFAGTRAEDHAWIVCMYIAQKFRQHVMR